MIIYATVGINRRYLSSDFVAKHLLSSASPLAVRLILDACTLESFNSIVEVSNKCVFVCALPTEPPWRDTQVRNSASLVNRLTG
jgi:hypothetical protein